MKTNLDELAAFVAVVDTGSITAAAQRLDLTVSGVSRSLNRLEEKLDTTLLRRTTRRLELTEEGAAFLSRARAVIDAVEQAEDEIAVRRQQPAGRLRVDAASPFVLHVLVPMAAEFRQRYPQIELELHSSDHFIDLIEQNTDVAIRIGRMSDSSLHARPLGRTRLRVLASPAYLQAMGRPRSVADLARHSLLGFTQPESLNRWPLQHPAGDRLLVAPQLRASSGETLRQLALHGHGLVCLADFMTHAERTSGELVQVLPRETTEVWQPVQAVYYRNTPLGARIACFVDFIAEWIGREQPGIEATA